MAERNRDVLTKKQRSYCMAQIKSKNTKPELRVRKALRSNGLAYRIHAKSLPGKPDIVFPRLRLAIFVDGDFWHGRQFSKWRGRLSPKWAAKIEGNKRRDQRQSRALRKAGWAVMRIWESQIDQNLSKVVSKIECRMNELMCDK